MHFKITDRTEIPYAIIGSGLLGLAIAYELVSNCQIEGRDIFIFDEGESPSNRLATYTSIGGGLCELGAGRFNPVLHPLLDILLRKFDIHLTEFEYEIILANAPDQIILNQFNELTGNFKKQSENSFFDFVCLEMGKDQAKLLCNLIGYQALHSKHLSISNGIKMIQTHPESIFRFNGSRNWFTPLNGFSELIHSLTNFLKSSGVNFFHSMRLCKISQNQEMTRLNWLKHGVEKIATDTLNSFFALPLSSFFSIPNTFNLRTDFSSQVVDVPLFKCFIGYKNSWWDRYKMDKKCVITGCELQKVYFNSRNKNIFFYCDSENASYFNKLWLSDDQVFFNEVCRQISIATHLPIKELEDSNSLVAKYWPQGVLFWNKDYSPNYDGYFSLNDNSFVCSDLFTIYNGWMEGALISAKAVSANFKAKSPLLV